MTASVIHIRLPIITKRCTQEPLHMLSHINKHALSLSFTFPFMNFVGYLSSLPFIFLLFLLHRKKKKKEVRLCLRNDAVAKEKAAFCPYSH